jgi:hypothetical protein
MDNSQITKMEERVDFLKLLNEYFLGLIHYQYSINNEEEGAVEAYKNQDEYLQDKLWGDFELLLQSERQRWVEEMREMLKPEYNAEKMSGMKFNYKRRIGYRDMLRQELLCQLNLKLKEGE